MLSTNEICVSIASQLSDRSSDGYKSAQCIDEGTGTQWIGSLQMDGSTWHASEEYTISLYFLPPILDDPWPEKIYTTVCKWWLCCQSVWRLVAHLLAGTFVAQFTTSYTFWNQAVYCGAASNNPKSIWSNFIGCQGSTLMANALVKISDDKLGDMRFSG